MEDVLRDAMKIEHLKRLFGGARGSQIAEAALIFPVMFTLFIAIFWFGRAFNVYATINQAAREGARAGLALSCGTCTGGTGVNTHLDANQVANVVNQSLLASHINASGITPLNLTMLACGGGAAVCNKPTGAPQICIYKNVQLDPLNIPPTCGDTISFQYQYQLSLPFTSLNGQIIQIPAIVQMQGEY